MSGGSPAETGRRATGAVPPTSVPPQVRPVSKDRGVSPLHEGVSRRQRYLVAALHLVNDAAQEATSSLMVSDSRDSLLGLIARTVCIPKGVLVQALGPLSFPRLSLQPRDITPKLLQGGFVFELIGVKAKARRHELMFERAFPVNQLLVAERDDLLVVHQINPSR